MSAMICHTTLSRGDGACYNKQQCWGVCAGMLLVLILFDREHASFRYRSWL